MSQLQKKMGTLKRDLEEGGFGKKDRGPPPEQAQESPRGAKSATSGLFGGKSGKTDSAVLPTGEQDRDQRRNARHENPSKHKRQGASRRSRSRSSRSAESERGVFRLAGFAHDWGGQSKLFQ